MAENYYPYAALFHKKKTARLSYTLTIRRFSALSEIHKLNGVHKNNTAVGHKFIHKSFGKKASVNPVFLKTIY